MLAGSKHVIFSFIYISSVNIKARATIARNTLFTIVFLSVTIVCQNLAFRLNRYYCSYTTDICDKDIYN